MPKDKVSAGITNGMTVREVIAKLVNCEMESEVCFAFWNSDPIPVTSVEENTEGQVVVSRE